MVALQSDAQTISIDPRHNEVLKRNCRYYIREDSETMQTRLTVTGANGFLGEAVCRLARRSGYSVTALVRNPVTGIAADRLVCAALSDSAALTSSFAGSSAVIHCAGLAHVFGTVRRVDAFHEVNVEGTAAVARATAAAKVPQLVLASSVSVYGGSGVGCCDELTPPHPASPYARSKLAAEQQATDLFAPQGTLSILRFATLYGEGDRGNIARLIRLLQRRRFLWPGSGTNRKSLLYKDDAARAVLACVAQPVAGIFNVSAESPSMRAIVNAICSALEQPSPRASIPEPLLRAALAVLSALPFASAPQQVRKFLQDDIYTAERFFRTFKFEPSVTLPEGMKHEVNWLRSQQR